MVAMQTFNEFKMGKEKQEIATLICDLGIDPDAFFEQVLNEGTFKDGFKKAGDWWKKNVTAPNVVRLQSSYDQAKTSMDNFVKNFMNLKKGGHLKSNDALAAGEGLYSALGQIRKALTGMQNQVASLDKHAQGSVQDTPYTDIQNWDGDTGMGVGQKAAAAGQAIGQRAGQAQQAVQGYQQRRADKRTARRRANDPVVGPMDRWQQQQGQ